VVRELRLVRHDHGAHRSVLGVIVTGPNATASVRYVTAWRSSSSGRSSPRTWSAAAWAGRGWRSATGTSPRDHRRPAAPTKLLAFGISSFYCGVAGAELVFLYFGSAETLAFDITLSFLVLFMVIIGGLGSILGSFLGAAFIVLVPTSSRTRRRRWSEPAVALQKQFELMVVSQTHRLRRVREEDRHQHDEARRGRIEDRAEAGR